MRLKIPTSLVLTVLLLSTGYAVANDDDRAAILALMDQAFYAVGSGDPDDTRAIQLAEGTRISFCQHPSGNPAELLMQVSTNEALLAGEAVGNDKFVER